MKKIIIIIIGSLLVLGVAAFFAVPYAISANHYEKAETLLAEKNYRGALAEFQKTENFRESNEKIRKLTDYIIPYDDAETMLANGEFEKAIEEFEKLKYYEDSPKKLLEAKYGLAERYFQEGEYEKAIGGFAELGDYGDSPNRILEAKYAIADGHFNNAEYAAAEKIFSELAGQNYDDSGDRMRETANHISYGEAVAALNKRDFVGAYEKFKALGNFLDCAAKLTEVDEAYWGHTKSQATMGAYDTYMKFEGAKHKTEAKAEYDRLYGAEQKSKATAAYNAAVNKKTIPELNAFISEWRNSPHVGDLIGRAEKWIASILSDGTLSAAILNDPNNATQKMIDDFLDNYPGHKDEAKVLALEGGDIFALVQNGTISVVVTGESIDFTKVSLTNKSKRDIVVTVPIGAYFTANSSSVQNMVVRAPNTVTVPANSTRSVSVATACMNIRRSIPGSGDGFSVQSLSNNPRLMRVMAQIAQNNVPYTVVQAAVWIVTDAPTENDLLNTLVYSDGSRVISPDDLAKAREIVRAAG